MISALRGQVLALRNGTCTVDVQGVGYAVHLTDGHFRSLSVGSSITLITSLVVREDSLTLYGFEGTEGLEIFEAFLGVSGVGPRSALAILSQLSPAEVLSAVVSEDDAPFRKVTGIGPKTAKLIVLQLSGKLNALVAESHVKTSLPSSLKASPDAVVTALVGLGWNEKAATDAVSAVRAPDVESAELLRLALAYLAGAR